MSKRAFGRGKKNERAAGAPTRPRGHMDHSSIRASRTRVIKSRPLALQIPDDLPRYWMDGDPYATHLLNALSITFPPGEKMFMLAVRGLRDHVKEPALQEQVKGFLAQEAL